MKTKLIIGFLIIGMFVLNGCTSQIQSSTKQEPKISEAQAVSIALNHLQSQYPNSKNPFNVYNSEIRNNKWQLWVRSGSVQGIVCVDSNTGTTGGLYSISATC